MSFTRYAVYYLPTDRDLAESGARWLGWDVEKGGASIQPDIPGLDDITMTPRKYGFHGTLKPPFRLAAGQSADQLQAAVAMLARSCQPATSGGLDLRVLGGFLALVPTGDTTGIARVAANSVQAIDPFRAPPGEAELASRRKAGLTARQETLLAQWGYPYVMEEFRFHLTLTGRLPDAEIGPWAALAGEHLGPLPDSFHLDSIALVGERATDGHFELIQRYTLTG